MSEPKGIREQNCLSCGHRWLGSSSTCSHCGKIAKSGDETFTKKVLDEEPDLKKAF